MRFVDVAQWNVDNNMADVGAVTEPPPAKQPTQRVCSGGGMGEVTKVQAEPVTKELLDEDGVPIMQYALAVPQGFGGDDGVTVGEDGV